MLCAQIGFTSSHWLDVVSIAAICVVLCTRASPSACHVIGSFGTLIEALRVAVGSGNDGREARAVFRPGDDGWAENAKKANAT